MVKGVVSCVLVCAAVFVAIADGLCQSPSPMVSFSEETLAIRSGPHTHQFRVEVARSSRQQAQGLMFRRQMAADRGMLFVERRPAPMRMWMRNTLIPLDMLFIGADGVIFHIVERTTPLSERGIPSRGAAKAVLEVNAGTVERLGIKVGDMVVSPALGGH